MKKARAWATKQNFRLPMRSIFERGDDGWGPLERGAKQDGHPKPDRQPAIPKTPDEALLCLTPLQAADFAGYEILKYYRIARDGDHDWNDVREFFKALVKSPPCEWGIVDARNISEFTEQVRVGVESAAYFRREPEGR